MHNVAHWLEQQQTAWLISLGFMGMLGKFLLLIRYHYYSDRRPFGDVLGDIFFTPDRLLALLDMSLVAINQWQVLLTW